jgi:hypothetical protein
MPLADELFDTSFADQLQHYDHCRSILGQLRVRGGESVEQVLQRLHSEIAVDPGRARQLRAVRFYLQEAIAHRQRRWEARPRGAEDNYRSVLEEIRSARARRAFEKVVLVTFNYDTLLDQAMSAIGGPPLRSMADSCRATRAS